MKIFMIVLGALLMLGGVSCLCTPVLTFVEVGYFVIMLLLVCGIVAVVGGLADKNFGPNFIFGILSIILSIAVVFIPGFRGMTAVTVMYMMAAWFIVKGIMDICLSVKVKGADNGSLWVCGIIAGILNILIGAYSAVHPAVLVITVGFMVGFYFIVSGIDLIASAVQNKG